MFSFFQTIFHKVTTVIATAAIAIGLISAPTPQTPVIINPTNITDTHQEAQVQAQKDNTNKAPEENVNLENLMKEMSSSAPQPALQPTQLLHLFHLRFQVLPLFQHQFPPLFRHLILTTNLPNALKKSRNC